MKTGRRSTGFFIVLTKNNLRLTTSNGLKPIWVEATDILQPNNSLSLRNLRLSDRASYKCRGKTRFGKMFDEVELIVQGTFRFYLTLSF